MEKCSFQKIPSIFLHTQFLSRSFLSPPVHVLRTVLSHTVLKCICSHNTFFLVSSRALYLPRSAFHLSSNPQDHRLNLFLLVSSSLPYPRGNEEPLLGKGEAKDWNCVIWERCVRNKEEKQCLIQVVERASPSRGSVARSSSCAL